MNFVQQVCLQKKKKKTFLKVLRYGDAVVIPYLSSYLICFFCHSSPAVGLSAMLKSKNDVILIKTPHNGLYDGNR